MKQRPLNFLAAFLLFFFAAFFCGAQTVLPAEETITETIEIEEPVPIKPAQLGTFFFTLGLNGIINTDSKLQSAPSPVIFSGGFGAHIPISTLFDFSPHVSFFMHYYLWTGEAALPAEIEHRTALTPSLMFDFPFTVSFRTPKMVTSVGAGFGILVRYGFLATGVPAADAYQIDLINRYLWGAGRWFYPSVQASWDYVFENGMAAGAGLRVYFPIAAAIDKKTSFAQNLMISFSVRLHLANRLFK